jgi:conserved oligomeric Golgi complex subunit 3
LFEERASIKSPPKATVARRAKSYSDFYNVARAQLLKDSRNIKVKDKEVTIREVYKRKRFQFENIYDAHEDELLDASQEEFRYGPESWYFGGLFAHTWLPRIYKDQLALSRRHLDGLLQDTTSALDLLANLSGSFKSVEAQTTAFQAQCEGLLEEQKHIKNSFEEVGTGLQYYAYLEPITRRLNAPGVSSVIGDDGFVEMLTNLDACIEFMIKHVSKVLLLT